MNKPASSLLGFKGNLHNHKGILGNQATIDLALDFLRVCVQLQLFQMDGAGSQLIIDQRIVVHDLDIQVKVAEIVGKVGKDKGFSVDRVLGPTLLA
jgi:hypothetical protein